MSLGFYVNVQRCIGCKTCQVACKDRHNLQAAGPRPRRAEAFECGTYPDVAMFQLSLSCDHCENPACVAGCPTGAMFKSDDGTVLHIDDRCVVCRNCMTVCPYGAPQLDEGENMVVKCDSARRCARAAATRCAWTRARCAPSNSATWTSCAPRTAMRQASCPCCRRPI